MEFTSDFFFTRGRLGRQLSSYGIMLHYDNLATWGGRCGREERHTVSTEISFELLTFMSFIADHNSTCEKFLSLEWCIINSHCGRSLEAHKSASSELKATIFACTLNISNLTDSKIVKADVKSTMRWLATKASVRNKLHIHRLNPWEFIFHFRCFVLQNVKF